MPENRQLNFASFMVQVRYGHGNDRQLYVTEAAAAKLKESFNNDSKIFVETADRTFGINMEFVMELSIVPVKGVIIPEGYDAALVGIE